MADAKPMVIRKDLIGPKLRRKKSFQQPWKAGLM